MNYDDAMIGRIGIKRSLKRIWCLYFHKRLEHVKYLSKQSELVRCPVCNEHSAMNHEMHAFLPWTKEFEDFYKDRGFL